MKPYHQDDAVVIYHGDCREILPQLEPVDLVLTDPCYGHGDKWQGGTWGAAPMYKDAIRWDSETTPLDLVLKAIAKSDRAVIWGGNYFGLPPSRRWTLGWDMNVNIVAES